MSPRFTVTLRCLKARIIRNPPEGAPWSISCPEISVKPFKGYEFRNYIHSEHKDQSYADRHSFKTFQKVCWEQNLET